MFCDVMFFCGRYVIEIGEQCVMSRWCRGVMRSERGPLGGETPLSILCSLTRQGSEPIVNLSRERTDKQIIFIYLLNFDNIFLKRVFLSSGMRPRLRGAAELPADPGMIFPPSSSCPRLYGASWDRLPLSIGPAKLYKQSKALDSCSSTTEYGPPAINQHSSLF